MTNNFNLYEVAKNIIKSKNPKEYIKKVKTKQFYKGYYLIDKESLVCILEKSKSKESKVLLYKINNNETTGYELTEEEINDKQPIVQYLDLGKNLINYKESNVRFVYDKEFNIYFRGKDVCNILGYIDIKQTLSNIKKNHKVNYEFLFPRGGVLKTTPLGNEQQSADEPQTIYINESGLYELLFRSKKKEAQKFTDWVTEKVLPSIRKNGYYKLHGNINLEEYDNKNCLYIFKVSDNIYKYGITKNIKNRLLTHKSNNLLKYDGDIIKIFTVPNYNILMDIENEFKKYCFNKKINYKINNYVELFKTNDIKDEIKKIQDMLNKKNLEILSNNENSNADKSIYILKLQNENLSMQLEIEKIKKEQLEIKNKMEIQMLKEQLKLKNEKINSKLNINGNLKTVVNNYYNNNCMDCKKPIYKKSNRCTGCENLKRIKQNKGKRPNYEQLMKDRKTLKSFVKIGKKYGVSDNAVRKWFKTYDKLNSMNKIN